VNKDGDLISQGAIDSILRNKVALKGPFMTPIGGGFRSLNVTLRKKLQLYANVRPCKSIEGLKQLYEDVDIVTIRENTEGEYSGLEHRAVPGVSESIKIISKFACKRVAQYAFQYAEDQGRERVTAVHKAGVMKLGDGLFLETCRQMAEQYPNIEYDEKQVDTMCMELAMDPSKADVMVMPNLYGDIVSDLAAGLIGGLGLTPSGNIGEQAAVFEAVHGTAPDIAGKNMANPTALLLSACMMLDHMCLNDYSSNIKQAVFKTLREGQNLTGDLGGKGTTTSYMDTIIKNLA
jgi:isocitrate dehydrogenase (NAD+)